MSKTIKPMLIAALAILLASCGSSTVGDPSGGDSASPSDSRADEINNSESAFTERQLVFGSLALEKTDVAISAEQAGSLLPMWQAYQSLLLSDTAAQAELSALLTQIEGEMTAEQLAEIAAMEDDFQDIAGLMDELGLQLAPGDGSADGARFGGEGSPEGFMPGQGQGRGGGQFPGGVEGLSPEQIATIQAENPDFGNRAGRANTALIEPLIVLLESKLN
jgi:hypothetical protein